MSAPLVAILAGGEARRIGGGKPLRMLGGERLIDRAVRLAHCWSDDVRLALRSAEQVPGLELSLLIDDPEIEGPLAGLASALRSAREAGRAAVLTIPCDTPFLPADLCARLQEALGGLCAAIAASGDDIHPTCALWRVEALAHLEPYLNSGRRSLKGFAAAVGFAQARWDPGCFFNVNTPEELAEAELRLRSEIESVDEFPGGQGGRSRR